METDEIRRQRVRNLRTLMDAFPTKEAFARRAGISASYLSQILHPDPANLKRWRPISEDRAGEIERRFGKPPGWLSADHDAPVPAAPPGATPALLALLETAQAQHDSLASQQEAIGGLAASHTALQAAVQIVIMALWEHDPALRQTIEHTMRAAEAQSAALGADALQAQARELRELAASASLEDGMRATLARLVRSREP